MMSFDAKTVRAITKGEPAVAWSAIIQQALAITSPPFATANPVGEVTKRDREVGALDLFLSSSNWELWRDFESTVERTSARLERWWSQPHQLAGGGKAVLILDGLSLRELPWLVQGAVQRGFKIGEVAATASELPGETDEFAQALGFSSRSQLQNNGGGYGHRLQPARTESVELPWADCGALVDSSPNWVFWHHWPDSKLHDGSGAGQGLDALSKDVAHQLASEEFWQFVARLAKGRRLVITSDHGYAATGYFPDAEGELGGFLKRSFASKRNVANSTDVGPFVPPVVLPVSNTHGQHLLALGRWKWKSQGGYPTLTHGGLTLLEVLSPWVELEAQG